MTIRVILVDDNPGIRRRLVGFLKTDPEIELIAESGDGREAFALACQLSPDVLVLDLELPGMNGDEIAHQLEECGSSVKILLMSAHMDRFYIQELLKAGAAAYLVKDEAWRCLAAAIRRVADGETGWFGSIDSVYRGVTQRIPLPC
jgi:DNA-binding NarL/FixJ family response regulator